MLLELFSIPNDLTTSKFSSDYAVKSLEMTPNAISVD